MGLYLKIVCEEKWGLFCGFRREEGEERGDLYRRD